MAPSHPPPLRRGVFLELAGDLLHQGNLSVGQRPPHLARLHPVRERLPPGLGLSLSRAYELQHGVAPLRRSHCNSRLRPVVSSLHLHHRASLPSAVSYTHLTLPTSDLV